MKDSMIRAITKDGAIKMTAIYSRGIVERARQIHNTQPVVTAALGRSLSAVAMLGAELKNQEGSVTLQIRGNGPIGSIVCVADSQGNPRGYAQNPYVDIPRKPNGKLDVGTAVGKGSLVVIKDVGMREPFNGTSALVNGEIAEDVTAYLLQSEQIPSACALGVLVDRDLSVKQAGGYIVQLLPGAVDADIDKLEAAVEKTGPITTMLEAGKTLEEIVYEVLSGFEVEILEHSQVTYDCKCNEDKVLGALISVGKEELSRIIEEEEKMEVTCQFCDRLYVYTREEMKAILKKASAL